MIAPQADPAQQSERRTQLERLRQAMGLLAPHQAKVLEMFYLEGFALAEIARQLNLREGAVKKRLFDARQRLRSLLSEDDRF